MVISALIFNCYRLPLLTCASLAIAAGLQDALSYANKAYAKCAGASRHPSSMTCCPCKAANIAAQAMAKCARARGSKDDITVLVVNLQQQCACKATRGPHNSPVCSLQQQQQQPEGSERNHRHHHHGHHHSHSRSHSHSSSRTHSRSHSRRQSRDGQAHAEGLEGAQGGVAAAIAAARLGFSGDGGGGGPETGVGEGQQGAPAAASSPRMQPQLALDEKVSECEPAASAAAAGGRQGMGSQLQKSDVVILPAADIREVGGGRGDAGGRRMIGRSWSTLEHSPVVMIPNAGGQGEEEFQEEEIMAEGPVMRSASPAAPSYEAIAVPGKEQPGVSSSEQMHIGLSSGFQRNVGLGEGGPPPAAAAWATGAAPSSSIRSHGDQSSVPGVEAASALAAAAAGAATPVAAPLAPVLAASPGAASGQGCKGAAGGGISSSADMDEGVVERNSSLNVSTSNRSSAAGSTGAAAWSPFKTGTTAVKGVPRPSAASGQAAATVAAAAGQCASPRVCPTTSTAELLVRGLSLRKGDLASSWQGKAGGSGVASESRGSGSAQQQLQQLGLPLDQQQQQELLSPFDQQQERIRSSMDAVAVPCQCHGHEQQHSLQELQAACRCHLQQQRSQEQQQGGSGDLSQQQWLSLRRLFSGVGSVQQKGSQQLEGKETGRKSSFVGKEQEQQQGVGAGGSGGVKALDGNAVVDMDISTAARAGQVELDDARRVSGGNGASAGPFSPFQAQSVLDFSRDPGLWGSRGGSRDGRSSMAGSPMRMVVGQVEGKGKQGVPRSNSRSPYASPVRARRAGSLGEKRAASCSESGEFGRGSSLPHRRLSQGGSCGMGLGELDGHLGADMLVVPT